MKSGSRILTLSVLIATLAACGGGGGSGGSSTPTGGGTSGGGGTTTKTPAQIIADAKSATNSQLKTAARSLASSSYSGSAVKMDMNVTLTRQIYRMIFDDDVLGTPELYDEGLDDAISDDGTVSGTQSCYGGGTVNYDGKLNATTGLGNITITFNQCQASGSDYPVSGLAAISLESLSENVQAYSVYLAELSWTDDETVTLSGMMSLTETLNETTGVFTSVSEEYVWSAIGAEQYLYDGTTTETYTEDGLNYRFNGRLSIGSEGYADLTMTAMNPHFPDPDDAKLTFNNTDAMLRFVDNWVLYTEDSDSDGEFDQGRYYKSFIAFRNLTDQDNSMLPLSALSIAPTISNEPEVITAEPVSPSADIVVRAPTYSDVDTPEENLITYFNWYVNSELVDGVNGDTFPAYAFNGDDDIQVTFVVDDSVNVVESSKAYINIYDNPPLLTTTGLPASAEPGTTVTFSVVMTDSDTPDNENLARLVGAPEGAVMDDEGNVSWQVPSKQPFPQQQYYFTFASRMNPSLTPESSVAITVSQDKALPVMRKGILQSRMSYSTWIDDFDGDGDNEVLTSSSNGQIYLQSLENGQFRQKWVYPYKFTLDSYISQVFPADVDGDGAPEILVLTDYNLWLLDDLNSEIQHVKKFDDIVRFGRATDVDNDGEVEFVYLVSDMRSGDGSFYVARLDEVLTTLRQINGDNVNAMDVGNVDGDGHAELITDTGYVYDLVTGEEKWYRPDTFGYHVTVGDINGDGIDEIIAGTDYSSISAYSAVSQSLLAATSVESICDLRTFKMFTGESETVLAGDCDNGSVTAFSFTDGSLNTIWATETGWNLAGSFAVGDVDNNGNDELLWTNYDKPYVADYTSVSVSPRADVQGLSFDYSAPVGWTNAGRGDEAVFHIPDLQNSNNSALVFINRAGEVTTTEMAFSNFKGGNTAAIGDVDSDGTDEIVMPAYSSHVSGVTVLAADSMAEEYRWQGEDANTFIRYLEVFDFNSDGTDDVVFAERKSLNVLDISNESMLANYAFRYNIKDFVLFRENSTPMAVVALEGQTIELLIFENSEWTSLLEIDLDCSNVVSYGAVGSRKIACFGDFDRRMTTYDVVSGVLVQSSVVELPYAVLDAVADPQNPQGFVGLTSGEFDSGISEEPFVRAFTDNGSTVWQSPCLIGNINDTALKVRENADGELEILVGTTAGAYWVH